MAALRPGRNGETVDATGYFAMYDADEFIGGRTDSFNGNEDDECENGPSTTGCDFLNRTSCAW